MAKLTKFLMLMSGLVLLFYFPGLLDKTPNATLLNLLLDPVGFQDTNIFVKALTVLELVAAAGIIVGTIVAQRTELIVVATFTIFLFNLLFDFIAIIAIVAAVNPVIAILLFAPLLFVYFTTVIEWFRGLTT